MAFDNAENTTLGRTLRPQLPLYFFRTHNGAEIDLVLEGPFGILPVEIKLGSLVKQGQLVW